MPIFTPDLLQEWTLGSWFGNEQNFSVSGFSIDTRTIHSGDMFIAIRTESRDGHDYLENARKSGAHAALVDHFNSSVDLPQLVVPNVIRAFQAIAGGHRKDFKGKIIGITGSCGKTSTKDLLGLVLGEDVTHKTEKNLNNELGVPLTLLKLDNEKHQYGVIEAGISLRGEMEHLARMIHADIAIITNIGAAHLEDLGSISGVAREKLKLFQYSSNQSTLIFTSETYQLLEEEFLLDKIVNGSNQREIKTLSSVSGDSAQTTTNYEHSHIAQAETTEKGVRLTIKSHSFSAIEIDAPLMSSGMLSNLGLVYLTASECGVSQEDFSRRLSGWKPTTNRGDWFLRGAQTIYVDCYNANPLSMKDALAFFHEQTIDQSARLFVLGKMEELGEQSIEMHKEVLSQMPLKSEDSILLIGDDLQELSSFMEGLDCAAVGIYDEISQVYDKVQQWEGYVFLKGSRKAGLERLLEGSRNKRAAVC